MTDAHTTGARCRRGARARPLLIAAAISFSSFAGCAGPASPRRGVQPQEAKSATHQAQVESIIDQMLAEERLRARQSRTPAKPVAMPDAAPEQLAEFDRNAFAQDDDAPAAADSFAQDVLRIQQTLPTWDNGSGIALKFLKEASGQRLSLVYVDPTPPEFQQDSQLWMIQATARTDDRVLGHFVMLLKDLKPGKFRGTREARDIVMSTSMNEAWDGKDPDTTWSLNEDSWCELVLAEGKDSNMLEGHFRAKLIDNVGEGFHNIESGYLYIKL